MHAKVPRQEHVFKEQQESQCSEHVKEAGGGVQIVYSFAGHCRNFAFSLNKMGEFRIKEWHGLPCIIKRQLWLMYWN